MRGILKRLGLLVRDESGDVLILGAVGMVAIVAFAGLAIDVGQLRFERRRLQAAADAAAMAGAIELTSCGGTANCSNMQTAAKQALVENGYTASNVTLVTQCASSSATNTLLTLNNGPCALGSTTSDPNYGNTGVVEAVVSQPQGMTFARVLGITSETVKARAEASLGSSKFCFYTSTQPSDQGSSGPVGMLLNGGTITSSCGIMDDSGSSNALESDNGTFTAPIFNVHGGWGIDNGGTFTPKPTTSATAVSDPLSYLTPPGEGTVQQSNNYSPGSSVTLQPGAYLGGININSGVTVTLSQGTYYMGGSINVDGSLIGNNVTLYFTSGTLQMNSGVTVQLTAPTSGTYAGIVLWQSSTNSNGMDIDSGSNSYFQGAIYLPDATLTLNSSCNTTAQYTIVDVNNLIVDSGAVFNLGNNYSSLANGSPIKGGAVMVE